MAKIIETTNNIEDVNSKNRDDKLNELHSKWSFCLEKLRSKEIELFTSDRIKSVACGIAGDQLESCINDLQEAKQAISSMEKYHRNCINLINNIYNKNN
tara:strand:+ start:118 stop:414 length:297 start_codon:yes stop_codon:yes gene_type:complete